jgi:hypothetical protein
MVTIRTTTTSTAPPVCPFDSRTSAALDRLIIELETTSPTHWRRRTIKLRKWLAERNVPAYRPNGGAR